MKRNRNIRYLTQEGIKNIGINSLMSVASVAVLMSCLVMIGSALLIFLKKDASYAEEVGALIMMAVAPVAYMFAEGWADSGEREKKNEK